jgi:ribosomal protein L11 methyltransferase
LAWMHLSLVCNADDSAQLTELMTAVGALAVTSSDAGAQILCEDPRGDEVKWTSTRLTGLFENGCDMATVVQRLRAAYAPRELPAHSLEAVAERDWERAWMERFKPMHFGGRLWVCPSWEVPPEPEAINVIVDPGRAFGTGDHESTALCLEWLEANTRVGGELIDYGCGSGILAVAGLRLGFAKAYAVDVEADALQASRENAERNGVLDRLELFRPEQLPGLQADVVVANILAGPLVDMAERISGLARHGGHVVLAGILAEQSAAVAQAYRAFLQLDEPVLKGDWVRMTGRRIATI